MILAFNGKYPRVEPTVFIAEDATVIGDVTIGPAANIWFQSVIRGDTNYISIGARCNIQDACVLHVVQNLNPVILEDDVALGHRAVVHGCRIGRGSLVGIGAIVLNGADVGEESIIGAGSVVAPRTVIPPRSLVMGVPAKIVRSVNEEDVRRVQGIIAEYLKLTEQYRQKPE